MIEDDLPKLRYTESVFSEALRLYPPAWGIGRRALEDFPVGGFVIPARSVVLMSPYVVHRDPRWWPNPEAFDPDRFEPEKVKARPRFSYFPFGVEMHYLLAMHLAGGPWRGMYLAQLMHPQHTRAAEGGVRRPGGAGRARSWW